MLPRSSRLRQAKEIQYVVRQGQRLTSSSVRLYYHSSRLPQTRVACVVGKAVDRSAYRRHRYQRWLRHIVKDLLRERPLPVTYDMVWVAQPGIKSATSQADVYQDVLPCWDRLSATIK